jgi:hypothetical protein
MLECRVAGIQTKCFKAKKESCYWLQSLAEPLLQETDLRLNALTVVGLNRM